MFAILLVGSFLPPLDFFIVNVALPSIQHELGASSSAEQLVISSYAALYAVTLITGGRLGDLFGRCRGPQLLLDRRQRDIDDEKIQRRQEGADQQDGEHGPAARFGY